MPFYDLVCAQGHKQYDLYLKLGERPPCPECNEPTETLWERSSNVNGDECDIWIRHGICHEDGSPKRYYSKSQIIKDAKAKGYVIDDQHITDPKTGSDKNPHTKRWF